MFAVWCLSLACRNCYVLFLWVLFSGLGFLIYGELVLFRHSAG